MSLLYPSLDEALHLHRRLLERFGGSPGVRDLGLLEVFVQYYLLPNGDKFLLNDFQTGQLARRTKEQVLNFYLTLER